MRSITQCLDFCSFDEYPNATLVGCLRDELALEHVCCVFCDLNTKVIKPGPLETLSDFVSHLEVRKELDCFLRGRDLKQDLVPR